MLRRLLRCEFGTEPSGLAAARGQRLGHVPDTPVAFILGMIGDRPNISKGWAVRGPSLLLLWLLYSASAAWAGDDGMIAADEAWQRSQAGTLVLIDIRTEAEWRETGIPAGAKLASLFVGYGLPNVDFFGEVAKATGGDSTRPVALICAGGVRSSLARTMLETDGYEHVFDVGEGMLGSVDGPGWLARGLPIEPCDVCSAP